MCRPMPLTNANLNPNLSFDLLILGLMHSWGMPWIISLLTFVLIAQTVLLCEHRLADRQTQQMQLKTQAMVIVPVLVIIVELSRTRSFICYTV